jgi:hypothetical protein
MDEKFMGGIAFWLGVMNRASEMAEEEGNTPYPVSVTIHLEGERVGELRDELGGIWTWHDDPLPEPPKMPRLGARMSCDCWWNATPGLAVGYKTTCPWHGECVMVSANVYEPPGKSTSPWRRGA